MRNRLTAGMNRLRAWRKRLRFMALKYRIGGRNRYVTCTGKVDGAGAQTQAVVSVMLFARAIGAHYVHTPFAMIDHHPGSASDWAAQWERFFNFGQSEVPAATVHRLGIPSVKVTSPFQVTRPGILYLIPHCYETWGLSSAPLPGLLAELRARFLSDKAAAAAPPQALRIAMHVRRGDVAPDGPNAQRYTCTDKVNRTYEHLIAVLDRLGRPYHVTLFSQGDPAQFQDLQDRGVAVANDLDPFHTFEQLVLADVLVTAKSSFSYLAALMSQGSVLYEPFWHSSFPTWLVLDEGGHFDAPALLRRLAVDVGSSPRQVT